MNRIPYDPTASDEQFREIPGYPGYCIGNYGTVLSCMKVGNHKNRYHKTWYILKPTANYEGYLQVKLGRRKNCKVHQLVLLAWIGPCPPGMEVCHFPDPTKSNCRLDNLQYTTPLVNSSHKVIHGTDNRGEKCYNSKLSNEQVSKIKELLNKKVSVLEIANSFSVNKKIIYSIKSNENWKSVI